jgi:hypothetical protein
MKYACPHCVYGELEYSKTPGKLQTHGIVQDCPACDGTGQIPDAIIEGLKRYCQQHNIVLDVLVADLKNRTDHFYFWRNNMYHGVEFAGSNRGYIHT